MSAVIGIDTGGTFTDLVLLEDTGAIRIVKRPSTPSDPAEAIFDGLQALSADLEEVDAVVLGTTVTTNAVLERRGGARVIYATTEGFQDVPIIGRIDKLDPYQLDWAKPEPYVHRADCVGVDERVSPRGEVVVELSDATLREFVASCRRCIGTSPGDGDIAVAINFLHSYLRPEHEQRAREALVAEWPSLAVSVSHEVSPVWREYERGSTTVLDAYVKPRLARLLTTLEAGLRDRGFTGSLTVMKSNGGRVASSAAAQVAIETVLSGLSGGIVAGAHYGTLAGVDNVLTFDMGGTSADVGVVRGGEIGYVSEYELDFGIPIVSSSVDILTIGAGGGSIAWVDGGGVLRVGPESAGSVPGPVCYGRGGQNVTVTDANLVLGRLSPDYFLGGELILDAELARSRVAELGAKIGLSAEEAAHSVVRIANERMAGLIRKLVLERGMDVRDFALVSFGGAGPLHGAEIARSLGVEQILVPPHPGLASALGTLMADRRVDRRWTQLTRSDELDPVTLNGIVTRLQELEASVGAALRSEGFTGLPETHVSVSMRYLGQNYEHDVPVSRDKSGSFDIKKSVDAFHIAHEKRYGYAFRGEPVELVHLNAVAQGRGVKPQFAGANGTGSAAPVTERSIVFEKSGAMMSPVYRREDLPSGFQAVGPLVIEDADATTLVFPNQGVTVLDSGTLSIRWLPISPRYSETLDRVERVDASIIGGQLVNITEEMGTHMMRAAYSPIFSESRDFSCALFDAKGQLIAQGNHCPAQLGAMTETVRSVLERVSCLNPGDVILHNDPYLGGCHLPEHMLMAPLYSDDLLLGFAATIGHLAEIGAAAIGSFKSDATEVFQEGLRLPPVKLVRAGVRQDDIWSVILANHRTPRSSWGDLHAMLGSLLVAERRINELVDKYGVQRLVSACDILLEHGELMMRRLLAEIPDGEYEFEDAMEDDGVVACPRHMRVTVVVRGDEAIVDYTGTDGQALGPVNATFGVTTSATYNAFLQLSGSDMPRNAGAYRPLRTIAPPGSLVNVRFPGPSVGGNTETQPRLVGMILGALASAIPERVMAAEGATSCNFLFGGVHADSGETYAHYHFEASGWGARASGDGNSAQNHIHGNCRNTPIEVIESRFPIRVLRYSLVPDSGGVGTHRGGLAVERILEILTNRLNVSAMMDRVNVGAWGLFGGRRGECASISVKPRGYSEYQSFSEAFGTASPSKFANVPLGLGDQVRLQSAGGGGFGEARERDGAAIAADVAAGYISQAAAWRDYGVVPTDEIRTGMDSGRRSNEDTTEQGP